MFLNVRTRDSSTRGGGLYAEDVPGGLHGAMCILTTNFRPLARKPSPQTLYAFCTLYALKKGPKDFIYTFFPSRRVDVSFRDESVYSVNITWWVAQWNLIIVYRFCSAKVFDNLQRGVKGTRRVVSARPKETDNIIVVVDGVLRVTLSCRRPGTSKWETNCGAFK